MKKNLLVDHLYTYPKSLPCLSSIFNIYDLTFPVEIMIYLLSDLLCGTVMTLYHKFPFRAIGSQEIDLIFLKYCPCWHHFAVGRWAIYLHKTTWFYHYSTRMMSKKIQVIHIGTQKRIDLMISQLMLTSVPTVLINTHWNENAVILAKFSLLAALKVVILTTSAAATDENLVKMTKFWFQCSVYPACS